MRRVISTILLGLVIASASNAAYDKKFFQKAAEVVWAMSLPEFNAQAQIPDSTLYNNESAVIIAAYDQVEVGRENSLNISKYTTTGRAYTNAIDAKILFRRMIKLNDSKAVEEYSEFDIDAKSKESVMSYSYQYSNSAFGARVHKPDGTIIDVDCSEAFTVTEGKGRKEKDVEHKIAIPGLEPGDVLDYFYYDEIWVDESDLDPIIFTFMRDYPTMSYKIDCMFDPKLTIEYRTLNGAPVLMGEFMKDGVRKLSVATVDLPKQEKGLWMVPMRQTPIIKMRVLNNTSTMVYHTRSARRAGVFCGLPPKYYYDDIASVLHDLDLPTKVTSKATKIVKKYNEAHPEISQRQLIDAAWLATVYAGLVDEDSHSTTALTIYFSDVLKKLKVNQNIGIGVVNPRDETPITQILHWREPDFMNVVGDSCYLLSSDYMCFMPGEIPGNYQVEQAAVLFGERKDFLNTDAILMQLPASRPTQNTLRYDISASLNIDDNTVLDVERRVKLDGARKKLVSGLVDKNRYIRRVERFLEIPEKDCYKIKDDSVKIKETMDEKFKKDAEQYWGFEPREICSYEISQIGATPDEPSIVFNVKYEMDGLVKRAGNDLIVSVGKLIGAQNELTGTERKRQSDVVDEAPHQNRYVITFDIPQGYVVNDASLAKLNKNVVNECGAFYAQARVQDGKLVLQINERLLQYVVPVDKWDKYLEILDAAVALNNMSVILNRAG